MDRREQLKNVSFGGAWSQGIEAHEKRAAALARLRGAIEQTIEEDLRGDQQLQEAVDLLARRNPKETEIRMSWAKALNIGEPVHRRRELERLTRLLEGWVG